MRMLVLALVLAGTSPVFAGSEGTHVWPFGPTTKTPLEVHYVTQCQPRGGHSIERDGPEIRVTAIDPDCSTDGPLILVKVPLPELLPFGSYRLEVRPIPQGYWPLFFTVRDAGPKPFEIHPFAIADSRQRLRLSGVTCDTADCSDVTVRVNGHIAAPLTRAADGAIWFTVPDIECEFSEIGDGCFLEVSAQKADFVSTSPAALYLLGPGNISGPYNLAIYEPILIPILTSVDGANGSKWISELTLSNPRPWFMDNANSIGPLHHCIDYPCGERIDPSTQTRFRGGFPTGKALLVPRPEAPDLALSLRIRDTSRVAEGLGTRVPIVREAGLFHGEPIRLIDVPLDPRYRVKVRVQMLEPLMTESLKGQVVLERDGTREHLGFLMTRNCGVFSCLGTPYYAEIDLPAGLSGERANLSVELPLDATGWAFATVTNNETQQVTIVEP